MEYFKIGKIVSTHGVSGRMLLQHSLGKRADFKTTEALFLEETEQSFIPWFITAAEAKTDNESFIELEGITSREEARELLKKEVWILSDDFHHLAASSAAISLLGYEIVEETERLGIISEVIEQPHQTLCKIDLSGKEAWIPLHSETLLKIDRKKKKIQVKLPDGLLDVYR